MKRFLQVGISDALSALEPQRFFLVAGLLGGLTLVAVTPPFQVPDEPAHFYRAYAVSQGGFLAGGGDDLLSQRLPSSLHRLVEITVDDVPRHPEHKIQPGTWRRALELRLKPEETEVFGFTKSLNYTVVPYLPQAFGIAVGRLLGVPPLGLLYLARTANLIGAIALIYLAICQLPGFRWLAALLALMPMAMFLRSSVSADAVVLAIAFLLTATIAKIAFRNDPPRGFSDSALLIVLSAALCLTKPVYLPLVFASFAIPISRIRVRRPGVVLLAISVVSVGAVTLGLTVAQPSVDAMNFRLKTMVGEVVERPGDLVGSVLVDYIQHAPRYGAEFIGRLGWLDTPLPLWFLLFYLGVLIAYTILDPGSSATVAPWQRIILAAVVAASMLAVSVAMYVIGGRIGGIQGRYFHPIALAGVWIFHSGVAAKFKQAPWIRPGGAVFVFCLSLVVTCVTITARYYGG
jgi:uncharacterized membrane protein